MLTNLLMIIAITLMYSAPLVFAAIGGIISERSGIVNIGIEGMMSIGAFAGAAVGYFTANPWLGLLCGGLAGMCLALFHAIATVNFMADQTISGIAINLIGPSLALFLSRIFFNDAKTTKPVPFKLPKLINVQGVFDMDITVLLAFLVVLAAWVLLYRTKWGLRIRALGEHPAAVDNLGVSVYRLRYVCVLLSGFLSGIGGSAVTLAIISQFNPTAIHGQGFIALAALIFGKWQPFKAYFACLLFGFAEALVIMLGGDKSFISSELLAMLPYILTIVMLIMFVGKVSAPKASGIPYEKGS